MWSSLDAGERGGVGGEQGDVPPGGRGLLGSRRAARAACLAISWATARSIARGPARLSPGARRRRPRGGFLGQTRGWRWRPGGPSTAGSSRVSTIACHSGRRWSQVEGVGEQVLRGGGADLQGDRQRLGGEGLDTGAPVAAEGFVDEQHRGTTPGRGAGLGGGGVHDRPLVDDVRACCARPARDRRSTTARASSSADGPRSSRPGSWSRAAVMSPIQAVDHRQPDPGRNPIIHRGFVTSPSGGS